MKKRYYVVFSGILMLAIVIFTANDSLTKSSEAPFGNTGSPGDGSINTCGKLGCHATSVNTGSGTLSMDLSNIPSAGWSPGKTYNIGVSVAEFGRGTFGFQLTVENSAGVKKGTFTGTNKVIIANTSWATHKGTSGTGNWTFNWTAPNDNTQQVIFYAAGVAANGNGQSTGEHVYTTSESVDKSLFAGIDMNAQENGYSILNNPVESTLRIEAPSGSNMILYNMSGQRELDLEFTSERLDINVEHLSRGMYILVDDKGSFARRIILK